MDDPIEEQNEELNKEEGTSSESLQTNIETPVDPTVEPSVISPLTNRIDIEPFTKKLNEIQAEAAKVLIGQEDLIELMLISICLLYTSDAADE